MHTSIARYAVILCHSLHFPCRHFVFFRLHLTTVRNGTYWKHKLNSNRKRAPSLPRMLPLLRFLFPPQPPLTTAKKYLKETYIILIENTPLWLRMSSLLRLPLASTSVNPLFSWIAFAWIPWIRITLNRFCLNPLNPNFKCCSRTESTYWIRILNAVAQLNPLTESEF